MKESHPKGGLRWHHINNEASMSRLQCESKRYGDNKILEMNFLKALLYPFRKMSTLAHINDSALKYCKQGRWNDAKEMIKRYERVRINM